MKWDNFLTDIADRYALSGTQRQWFLMRFSEEHLKKDDREFEVFLADLEMQDPRQTPKPRQHTSVRYLLLTDLLSGFDDDRLFIEPNTKCGPKDLFTKIMEFLKHRAIKGTVSDFRARAMEVLQACQVEMLIVDEADRLKPETFADVRDIYDKLEIAVVLVGTNRLDTVLKRDEQVYNRFRACYGNSIALGRFEEGR